MDDDFDIASLIKVSLEKVGLSALPFINPLEALETFRSGFADYDLVISDIKMPHMNDYEFVKEIKKIKSSVKILLMSAFEYSDLPTSLSSETEGVIEKHISICKLNKIILGCMMHDPILSHKDIRLLSGPIT